VYEYYINKNKTLLTVYISNVKLQKITNIFKGE